MASSVNPNKETTSLHHDIIRDEIDETVKLIEQAKKEKDFLWYTSNEVLSACRDAILQDKKEIVQIFLNAGMRPDTDAYVFGNRGFRYPLIYFAAKVNNLRIVQLLVEKGARIKQRERPCFNESDHQEAMRIAIEEGHAETVQYLLENGGNADGSFKGQHGLRFLGEAAMKGHKQIVDLLVQHGADINRALSSILANFTARYIPRDKKISYDDYYRSVQMLLDHACGTDFSGVKDGLEFLKHLKADISNFNFVGMSIDGVPITREMLLQQGFQGVEGAIFTENDISHIEDEEKRTTIQRHLDIKFQAQGKIVYDNGIVNLVPLADAAKNGFLDVVQVRLSTGVNPNQTTSARFSGCPAIVAAAQKGHFEVVAALAQHPQIDPKMRVEASNEAQKHGYIKIAEYLSNFNINELNRYGNALIHEAAEKGDINQVQELLQRGADINLANRSGETPLCIAASNVGSIEYNAISSKHLSLIKCLLANGADPNKYVGTSPLERAAMGGSFEAMSVLLEVTYKSDKTETIIHDLSTEEIRVPWFVPLMFESYGSEQWLSILDLLARHGADLNAANAYGNRTLLSLLIKELSCIGITREELILSRPFTDDLIEREKKKFEVALEQLNCLLKKGLDPKVTYGPKEKTALHDFIEEVDLSFLPNATEAVIERLMQAGADINAPDVDGMTPLHVAVMAENLTAAACLISKGADVDLKNKEGKSPLEMAGGDAGILAALQEKNTAAKS
ncbi:MAG: hypothetical protein COT84_04875 [Chlamydiae bacterium CG10_big_fil_rev_8_21_14_0_10_35_9]|nr:MAG: hypothetical protein COT84_04875 [Chlamydiae bacterium CG10_big_fil_rev_8_21_14_0_10_35_9]